MDERYDDGSYTIIVPVLNDDLSLITFVVPTEFKTKIEMKALELVESFEQHPANGSMDPNNKIMQAMSYIIQSGFESYFDDENNNYDGVYRPPDISE